VLHVKLNYIYSDKYKSMDSNDVLLMFIFHIEIKSTSIL